MWNLELYQEGGIVAELKISREEEWLDNGDGENLLVFKTYLL